MRFIRQFTTWISISWLLSTYCYADEHHKRVPSGFTGVRGKKSIPDDAYSVDLENTNSIEQQADYSLPSETETPASINYIIEKRAPSGFFGMRGKKPWNYLQTDNYPEEMYKRAPMGFVGMRGKKDSLEDGQLSWDEPAKKAQMGFFGMRGKKMWMDYQGEKRAPMGFVGMRGKKDFENPTGYYEDMKRAPSGFFGMRGKKHPSGFFGMRGKKYPFEFRGKFVGVRGKKSLDVTIPSDYYQDLDRLNGLDFNQLMVLLTGQNEFDSSP